MNDIDWTQEKHYHSITRYMNRHELSKEQKLTILMNLLIDTLVDRNYDDETGIKSLNGKVDIEKTMMDLGAFVKKTQDIIEELNDTIHDFRRMKSLEKEK